MSEQTRFTYRLRDLEGRTLDERELPTDGEALAWAEEHRREGPGLVVVRVERRASRPGAGAEELWEPVEEGGPAAADRGSEDL